jgi:hypothetical protein
MTGVMCKNDLRHVYIEIPGFVKPEVTKKQKKLIFVRAKINRSKTEVEKCEETKCIVITEFVRSAPRRYHAW